MAHAPKHEVDINVAAYIYMHTIKRKKNSLLRMLHVAMSQLKTSKGVSKLCYIHTLNTRSQENIR